MRIAMIGQRGMPATFGGIERHVEELGAELVERGHDVTVFCRPYYVPDRPVCHRGVALRYLPTVSTKHFDAICHSGLSTAAALARRFDIVHYHALGPGLLAPLPRWLSSAKVVLTVHGRDDQRAKWGVTARSVLRTASWMSARVPDATIVVSKELDLFYASRYGRATDYIPNGVVSRERRPSTALTRDLGLKRDRYLLFVGRLVPEKAPDLLIRAFRHVEGDLRLALVGGSSFSTSYVRQLRDLAAADPRVSLVGFQYGHALDELYTNAAAFVLPSALEGLPLTLLEAGSFGAPIVASDIPPHLEILGNRDRPGRRIFASGDEAELVDAIRRAIDDPAGERAGADSFRGHIVAGYRWGDNAERTEQVYRRILRQPAGRFRAPEAAASGGTR